VRKSAILFLLVCLALFSLELIVRAIGHQPYTLPEFSFTSEPNWCFAKDSLGVVPIPGSYVVNLNGLEHVVTHSLDSNRITSFTEIEADLRPTVYMYGCSYTYGQGVDDSLTYPFLLQQEYSDYEVLNYSRPGYGTIQALLHLKSTIDKGDVPNLVIVNFASFHEERNVQKASSTSYIWAFK
jgi:hypothetical protein